MWELSFEFSFLSLCQNNLSKIMDLKVAPVPPISCPISTFKLARSSKFPTSQQTSSSSQDRPALWPPIPTGEPNPWPLQELKLSPQRVRFASKAAALLFAWAAKAVVEAISGGGWGRMELTKRGECLKEKGNLARRW